MLLYSILQRYSNIMCSWLVSSSTGVPIQNAISLTPLLEHNRHAHTSLVRQRVYAHFSHKYFIGLYHRRRVSSRQGSTERVEVRGIFAGARVVRGPDWRWGDQDGGMSGIVLAVNGWQNETKVSQFRQYHMHPIRALRNLVPMQSCVPGIM
jgi:hypothetical protein